MDLLQAFEKYGFIQIKSNDYLQFLHNVYRIGPKNGMQKIDALSYIEFKCCHFPCFLFKNVQKLTICALDKNYANINQPTTYLQKEKKKFWNAKNFE